MKTVNRYAILVRPRQPFFAWAHSLEENSPVEDMLGDRCSVYLVDEAGDKDSDKVVKRHVAAIFEEQLVSWHRVADDWPQRRTLAMFRDWFDVQVVDLVFDLGRGPVEQEDW